MSLFELVSAHLAISDYFNSSVYALMVLVSHNICNAELTIELQEVRWG